MPSLLFLSAAVIRGTNVTSRVRLFVASSALRAASLPLPGGTKAFRTSSTISWTATGTLVVVVVVFGAPVVVVAVKFVETDVERVGAAVVVVDVEVDGGGKGCAASSSAMM
jgi:hypothetical protein